MPETATMTGKRLSTTRAALVAGAKRENITAPDPEFDPLSATWSELHQQRKALRWCSRGLKDADPRGDVFGDEGASAIEELTSDIQGELDRRDAAGTKEPLPDPRRPVESDKTGGFEDSEGRIMRSAKTSPDQGNANILAPETRCATHYQAGADEYQGLSMGRYLRSMVLPEARGDLEKRALAGGSDSAGGYAVPQYLASDLIDRMRARNTAIQAGAQTVPLQSDQHHIARVATDPTPSWRAENTQVAEDGPTFDRIEFQPKTLAVTVRASRELLQDSVNIERELPSIMSAAMAQELDRAIYLGSGADNEPLGLDNMPGVLNVAHDAAISDYSPFITARRMLMNQNAERMGPFVTNPDVEAAVGSLMDNTGQPLQVPPVLNRPSPFDMLVSSKLPSNLGTNSDESTVYGGDMSQLAIGVRLAVDIQVLRERFADFNQVGFLIVLRADVMPIRANHLIRISGVKT